MTASRQRDLRAVDGLPLAIELAADRARLLPLPALLERLEHRLDLSPAGPGTSPYDSVRCGLARVSWEALEDPERELLGRLSVFEGGASLEAAEAVCAASSATAWNARVRVARQSSLFRTDSGQDLQPRFGCSTRSASSRPSGRASARTWPLERRHAEYFLRYCEHAAEQAARTDQREWLARLAQERGNIRLAFERLMRAGAVDEALRVAIAFARALPWDAHAHEVRVWLAQGLAASAPATPAQRASALYWDGTLALSQGLVTDARTSSRRP